MFDRIRSLIWDTQAEGRPFFVAWPLYAVRLVTAVARDLGDGFLGLRATSLVYTTLLSLAPLLAISFAVLKGFGVHNQAEPFLREFLSPLGQQGEAITLRIVEFVDNINVGVLGAVGVGLLLYSVIALMHKIETAFNEIWNVPATRSFTLRVRDYLGVLMIGPLFLFLSIAMTTGLRHASFVKEYLNFDIVSAAFDTTFWLMPYALFALAFTAIYMFMPNTRVRFLPAFVAGCVTGMLWKVLGFLFGVFVAGSASYAAIYSAFAALILFIFWLYVGWLIVLVGASIAYYLQYPSNQRLSRKLKRIGARMREKMTLLALAEIGRAFYAGEKPLTPLSLSRRLRLPLMLAEDITAPLVVSGTLALAGDRQNEFIPARPFDTTSVYDALHALYRHEEDGAYHFNHLSSVSGMKRIMTLSDDALRAALGKVTLKQLALGEVAP